MRYAIWIEQHYYDGTYNAPVDGWMLDDYGFDHETYPTEAAAQAAADAIRARQAGTYYLSHGEYSRPEYSVRQYQD